MQNKSSLIITGGWAHDFASSVPFLVENLREVNIDSEIAWDVDQSTLLMQQNKYDLIVGYACWFQMKDSRYSPEQRTQWSRTTSGDWRDALLRQKNNGAGLLALHTAIISFDDAPTWSDWAGGSWSWGVSHHPQPGDVEISVVAEHPIVDGIKPFVVHDERYMNVARASEAVVLTESLGQDGNQASMWLHNHDGSRSVYSALGHDQRSLTHPSHQLLLRRAAHWAASSSDDSIRSITA